MSIPLEKCNLFGVSLHPIPEKEASLSGTECIVFMSNNYSTYGGNGRSGSSFR